MKKWKPKLNELERKNKILLNACEVSLIVLGTIGGNRIDGFWRKEWETVRDALRDVGELSPAFNHPSGQDREGSTKSS